MTTPTEAATALTRANADLFLGLAAAAQENNRRWLDIGTGFTAQVAQTPRTGKANWDKFAAMVNEVQVASVKTAQDLFSTWQSASADAVKDMESPLQNETFAFLFKAWTPAAPTDEKTVVVKTKAPTVNA